MKNFYLSSEMMTALAATAVSLLCMSGYVLSADIYQQNRSSETFNCFHETDKTQVVLGYFLASTRDAKRDAAGLAGLNDIDEGDVRSLVDVLDAELCVRFNEIHAETLSERQAEPGSREAEFLDEDAYAYDILYYKAGEYYLVVIGRASLQTKDATSTFVSTGGGSGVIVYDVGLNRIGIYDSFGNQLD